MKFHFKFPYTAAGWNYWGFCTIEAESKESALEKALEIAQRKNPTITKDEIEEE